MVVNEPVNKLYFAPATITPSTTHAHSATENVIGNYSKFVRHFLNVTATCSDTSSLVAKMAAQWFA